LKRIKDVDYLYATARLRALEREMLSARDFQKMVDAATLEESYKTANDVSLHSSLPATRYEQAIADMLSRSWALVSELTGNSPALDVFRIKYDGHNLKTIIKSQALGSDPLPLLSPLGTLAPEALLAAWREREQKPDLLPGLLKEATLEAAEALAKTGDPQKVDVLIDRAVLEGMLSQAKEVDFDFLTDIVRTYIDIENLRTAVRLKRIGRDVGLFRQLAVEGGKLPLDRLFEAYPAEGFDALRDVLFVTEYSGHFAPLLEGLQNPRKPLTEFERGADNYQVLLLRRSRLVSFGFEPVLSYLLAKENEGKQIRIVLASKAAGVEREKISERLRETYA
jgi:V/A-type H+-transporting ATPase subunit C